MGAVGAKGTLMEAPAEGGVALGVRSDAMWVVMESDALRSGNLAAAAADVSRLRVILEGSRTFALGSDGSTLTPVLEVGLRHDGGDADTGAGIEVGGRLSYAAPGVTVKGAVRSLVSHDESGYNEWGVSGSVRIDPGSDGRGLSFTLTPTWGSASSGTERLWSLDHAEELGLDGTFEAGRRFEMEAGYGLWLGHEWGVLTPYAGLGQGEESERAWRLGARWALGSAATLGLEGTRREAANEDEPAHALALRASMNW